MKGDLQCDVGNAEQHKPDVEDDKRSLQKCREVMYHSHHSPQNCETLEPIALFSAAFIRERRHASSVPPAACRQAGSFCLQPISQWQVWGNGKWPHCCPVSKPEWEALAAPWLPPHFSPTQPSGVNGFWSSVALWYWSALSRAACRSIRPSQTSLQLLTRGDASLTSVGKSLYLIPDSFSFGY